MAKILIAEDDRNTLSGLVEILQEEGYEVKGVDSGKDALRAIEREAYDILLTDLKMPDFDGLQLYEASRNWAPDMRTIVMTAFSSVKEAVEAMKRGVYEYLTKPLNLDELFVILKKAAEEQNLQRENRELKDRLQKNYRFEGIIGQSAAMQQVYRSIAKVSQSQATVLIRGESGTGKELVAKLLHHLSGRTGALVAINCGALPESLLESELFGIEGGVATGVSARRGKFELADGGTLFLDEIGDMAPALQVKLLRALQEREIVRIGGETAIPVDVRLVAATHRGLESLVSDGKFREDLYYRLKGVELELPPLRERREEIPLLVRHFLERFCRREGIPVPQVSRDALALLLEYDYPGNVRELQNLVDGAVSMADGPIEAGLLRSLMGAQQGKAGGPEALDLESVERRHIERVMKLAQGNKSAAAKLLGVDRRTLLRKGY
jgi:DNA-binding NtrC family response regulator